MWSQYLELPIDWLHLPIEEKPLASFEALIGMSIFYIATISILSFIMRDQRAKDQSHQLSIASKKNRLRRTTPGTEEHDNLQKQIKQEEGQYKTMDISFFTSGHNLIMCLYSLYAFVGVSLVLLENLIDAKYNIFGLWCDSNNNFKRGLEYWAYTFYISKFLEYIDTIFLLLKAKPIMPPGNSQYFLHIYHHAITAGIVWVSIRYNFSTAWTGPLTNSFVHILMYGYYFLVERKAIDRNLGGKFITPIQLIQFLFCVVSVLIEMVIGTCNTDFSVMPFMIGNYMIFFVFFAKIFYDKKKERSRSKEE